MTTHKLLCMVYLKMDFFGDVNKRIVTRQLCQAANNLAIVLKDIFYCLLECFMSHRPNYLAL